jgi:hypothetical protein
MDTLALLRKVQSAAGGSRSGVAYLLKSQARALIAEGLVYEASDATSFIGETAVRLTDAGRAVLAQEFES